MYSTILKKTFQRSAQCTHLYELTRPVFAAQAAELQGDLNAAHPFREGNGRTHRDFLRQPALQAGHPQLPNPPAQVTTALGDLRVAWQVLTLAEQDDVGALFRCRDLNLSGGVVDDTLVALDALPADASALVILNAEHFVRFGEDVRTVIVTLGS
ncbi:Fic family protein [Deinococcus sp.]|uniref:Fic family protein n=1 Tax=Deinococcus sp. TaxID=47478 RepID=UPI002869C706|nr:Fic family protein [Deinococcus sp.]